MIAVDLCQPRCQVLLITYQKLTKRNVKKVWKKYTKSECKFIKFENNRLNYKCKECNDKLYKSINELIKQIPKIYQFCNGDLNKFSVLLRKGVCPMNIWIAGKNLAKHYYLTKNLFIAN